MTERITQGVLHRSVLHNLQTNLTRMQGLQERLSSGRQISRPSDSPAGTVSALRFRAEMRRNDQLTRNAVDGMAWLGTADGALVDGLSIARKARDLVLGGANSSVNQQGREAMAAEIEVLRDGLLVVANTSYLGRSIFAGTADAKAFDATGAYLGDSGLVVRNVGDGVQVAVNVPGDQVFIDQDSGQSVFALLSDIAAHLRSGDQTALSNADLEALDGAIARMTDKLSTVGARYHQVDTMKDRADAAKVELTSGLAEVESIDLPATIVELQMQEVAYQAALGAAARTIQPSLMEFLR